MATQPVSHGRFVAGTTAHLANIAAIKAENRNFWVD